jgi:hypothetical protein
MNFKERVLRRMEQDEYNCETIPSKIIDMICTRKHRKTALRIKQHGHLYPAERQQLKNYGARHKLRVLYIHETGERELRFTRIYPVKNTHGNGTQNSNV